MRSLLNIGSSITAMFFIVAALVFAHGKDYSRASYYLVWAVVMISVNKSGIAGD